MSHFLENVLPAAVSEPAVAICLNSLFIVGIRSCLSVFQLYSFFSSAFAIFFLNIPLGVVAISLGYYLWSNAAAKTKKT